MPLLSNLSEANFAVTSAYAPIAALFSAAADAEKLAQLNALAATMIIPERISAFFEFGYANRTALDAGTRSMVADVGAVAARYQLMGLGVDDRGYRMIEILRGAALPAGIAEPEPSPQYAHPSPVTPQMAAKIGPGA